MTSPDNQSPPPHPLPYAAGQSIDRRRRLVRWIALIILAKFVLVILNVGMAFGGAPDLPRLIGIGAQIALTGLFLLLILKLVAR